MEDSRDRKSTRLNSSHSQISTLSLHDALPISRKPTGDILSSNVEDLPIDLLCHAVARIIHPTDFSSELIEVRTRSSLVEQRRHIDKPRCVEKSVGLTIREIGRAHV